MKEIPTWAWRTALLLSATYCLTLGVFSIAWPLNGVDFEIFHAAGSAIREGLNPYSPGVIGAPLAYPPSWMPFCAVFALLPFGISLPLWKALNIGCLIGSVQLSIALIAPNASYAQRSLIWCYSLLLWPTITTFFTGNTPLLLLVSTLYALDLSMRKCDTRGAVFLSIALVKPMLAIPTVVYLLFQRKFALVLIAGIISSALWIAGIYITGLTFDVFIRSIKAYSEMNLASDPTTVGMPHVLAGVFGLGSTVAREVSFASGMILMLLTIPLLAAKHVPQEQTPLPLLLLLGPVFFGPAATIWYSSFLCSSGSCGSEMKAEAGRVRFRCCFFC